MVIVVVIISISLIDFPESSEPNVCLKCGVLSLRLQEKNRQVENCDFWGQMDVGPNPSSQMQCRARSLLSEPLVFFKRGREMLTLQIFRTAKLNEMFTAL